VRSFRDKKQFFEACKDSNSNLNKRKHLQIFLKAIFPTFESLIDSTLCFCSQNEVQLLTGARDTKAEAGGGEEDLAHVPERDHVAYHEDRGGLGRGRHHPAQGLRHILLGLI
jgi:hypothetical protein